MGDRRRWTGLVACSEPVARFLFIELHKLALAGDSGRGGPWQIIRFYFFCVAVVDAGYHIIRPGPGAG